MDWLGKSLEFHERLGRETYLTELLFDECWDGLRDDPRFKDLLDKTGFTRVMPSRKR